MKIGLLALSTCLLSLAVQANELIVMTNLEPMSKEQLIQLKDKDSRCNYVGKLSGLNVELTQEQCGQLIKEISYKFSITDVAKAKLKAGDSLNVDLSNL